MTPARLAARLLLGGILAWLVAAGVAAPEMPPLAAAAVLAVAAATVWNPAAGLVLAAGLVPAGLLMAAPPVRAAETLAWTWLAAWLAAVWRPLAPRSWPPAAAIPAALFAAALVASWLMVTVGEAQGVPAPALPAFLLRSFPGDYLAASSPEPETWTLLQSATGVGILLGAIAMGGDPRFLPALARMLVASAAILAALTLVDVGVQWSEAGYGGWFLQRYVDGERFSLHMPDLNAAGSVYALAGIIAAAALMAGRGWGLAGGAALIVIVPALWLAGSRSAGVAAVAACVVLAASRRPRLQTRPVRRWAAVLVLAILAAGVAAIGWRSAGPGSATRSADLRSQFLQTSVRMTASAPVYGVGVGRYFNRSAEFMPAELRDLYGNENAHNYFAQQFAELGIVGGLLFLWLAGALLATGWAAVRRSGDDWLVVGVYGGVAAYLVTCVTGHPLLVPEAAYPFWAAAGALAGAGTTAALGPAVAIGPAVARAGRLPPAGRLAALVAVTVLASGVIGTASTYGRPAPVPADRGFHEPERADDDVPFRWMTAHGVTYVPDGPGFVRLTVRAPDRPESEPVVLEAAIAGEPVLRRTVPSGTWLTYEVPIRRAAGGEFRRVDLRTSRWWMQDVRLGQRDARRPIALMVRAVEWIPLGGR